MMARGSPDGARSVIEPRGDVAEGSSIPFGSWRSSASLGCVAEDVLTEVIDEAVESCLDEFCGLIEFVEELVDAREGPEKDEFVESLGESD